MAKKKPNAAQKPKMTKPTLAGLTIDQIKWLADKLRGTTQNVYTLVRAHFNGLEVGDGIFDRLRKEAGLFKCEYDCNEWQDVKEEECPEIPDCCLTCADAMNADEDDED
jgi:hypothetical protein